MKKHLFFLFAALALLTAPGAMRAQTTVTIGDESSTGSVYIMPVNMYYNYSLTQQIYRADEINMPDGGTITSISFEYLYSGAFSLSGIKVFMKNTTKESFTNNNDWVEVSASDKVFEGTFSASGAGWVTLTLNTPFHYDGTSNLLVCFYDPTNGYPGSSYTFRTTSTTSDYPDQYLALTCNSDSYVPDPDDLYSYSGAKGLQTIRNNIRLTINPDITEVFVNDVTLPAWGEHPDYDWSVPSDANYYINATESKWQDATTSGNLFSGNVFDQMGHDYVLKLQFESIYGWHISNNVAVYLNDDPSLIASTAFNTSGRLVAQTIPFNVYPYDVVNIGDGTSTSYYAPYNSLWGYSFVEQIYTADEIAMPAGGTVTSISFNMQSSEEQTNHITVYMKNVSRSAFDNSNDYETVTSSDIVFEGDYTFVQGWNTIPLNTPYQYNGTDNLMIAFHENTPGYSTRYFYYTYKEGSVLSAHSDYDDPDPYDLASFPGTKYIQNYRANIRIAFVEPIVEIGSGNVVRSDLPTNVNFNYSLTEQIYMEEEIGQAGDIYTIAFYNTSDAKTRNIDIYMRLTDQSTFSSGPNWTVVSPSNLVYSGDVTFLSGTWTTIELNNPFHYPGSDNIMVVVDDNTGNDDFALYFKVFDATSPQALYIYDDNTNYNPNYSASIYNWCTSINMKNQIQLGFTPILCHAPTNLAVSNIGSVGAGVSWDQPGSGDYWIVQCSTSSDFSTFSEVTIGSSSWYIYGLSPNTTYYVRVANRCGPEDISSWSSMVTFTTTESPCIAPTDLTVSNVSYNGADLTWNQPGDGYEWLIEYSINPEFSSSSFESSFDPYLSLTGLDPITTYYVRVANECGTLGNSEWVTTSFTTTGGVIVIPDIIDFEPGDFSQYPFVNDATYPWIIVDASDGCDNGSTYCMRSGNAGIASSSSTIEATYDYPDAGYITFDAKCMGEGTNWDVCKFFIDGALQFSYGEYMAGWNHYSYIVPAGTHTFTWSYTKDSSVDPDGDGFFVDNIEFGIGMPCLTPPIDLTAYNITDNSVDVSWTGSGEAYTVKYRPVLLFDDFENGLSQWTQIDADGDGYGWLLGSDIGMSASDVHSGTDMVLSQSYDDYELYPDNYLVSPLLSLGGQLEFWARAQELSYPNEHFSIAVSTTGNTDPADFQTVPGAEWTLSADEWQQFIVDLSAYAGEQGYVALRHHDCTDQYYLDVDDFIIYAPGEWQTVTTTSDNTHLTGLNPETQYIFQVQSDCGSDGTSEWSELMSFITTNVTCSAPTNLTYSNLTANSIKLDWTATDGYEWYIRYSTVPDFSTYVGKYVTTHPWTLTGLTPETTYYVQVQSNCGSGLSSVFSSPVTFTTLSSETPSELTVYDATATNGYVPVYGFYADAYLKAEYIMNASELTDMTNRYISRMTFYATNPPEDIWDPASFKVFLKEVSFTTLDEYTGYGDATVVYEGSLYVVDDKMVVDFNTPYFYEGGNLLVGFYNTVPGNYRSCTWAGMTVDGASVQGYSYSSLDQISVNQRNFVPKTTFRYALSPALCPTPNNLTFANVLKNSAELSWNERGSASDWVVEYGTTADFSDVTSINVFGVPEYTITGLTPETTYYVHVSSLCGPSEMSDWSVVKSFTTPEQCPTPTDIEVEPGSNRVTITWNGGNNSSDFGEFKVRKAGHYADTLFFDGFENGLDQWTVYVEGDASHNGWLQVDPRTYLYDGANYMDRTPYRGDYVAYASSYDGSSFDADNWLVTPQLELQGVVNFWVENRASNYLDSYEVLLSTGSNSPSDFTVTLQAMTQPSTEWSEVTLDLSAYAGQQGYIAIRQSSYDKEGILLDNFGIYNNYQEPSAWLTGVTAYSPATFEEAFYSNFMAESMPIEPGTKYDFMIMEQCDGGGGALYGSSSAWTEIHSFVTYPCEVTHLTVETTTNGEAEVSWTSGASVFELRYRPEGSGSWTTVTGITDNSYMITGLPVGNYEVEVAPNCDPTNFTSATFNIVNVQSTANWYTYANYNNDDDNLEYLHKFVSFSMDNPAVVAEASGNIDNYVRSAACVDGQVWFTTSVNGEYVYRAPLDNVNKTIGAYEAVSSLSLSGSYAHAMSYNPDDGQIYYVVYDGGYTLNKFDPTLASPVSSLVGTFSISANALAINSAGEAYCLDENGNLYQVNLTDATTTLVANTGKSTGNYWQSMAFDLNTGELFWSQYYENDIGLYLVEPATATVHQVGQIGDGNTQFIGMFMVADETPTQPLVEIGSGESTNGYLPTYILYNYTLSQQIYTAAEIGQAGDIYSVAFYNTSTNGTTTRDIDIYMLHSDKTTFSDASDFVPVTAADRVFSGYVTVDPNCWITIELSTPFAYNGTDNLILIVDDNTGTWTSNRYFRAFNAPSQAIRVYNDDTDYDPYNPSAYSGTVLDVKNQIQLGFVPILCHNPTNVSVYDVGVSSASLNWTETGTATTWQICVNGDEDHLINVTSTNYTFTGLTPGTTYSVKVRANCGGSDGVSEWSMEKSFTTYTCEVSDLTVTTTLAGDANLTWDGHTASYILRYRPEGGSWTTVSGITDNSYTITGLPVGDYEVEVAPDCDPTNFTSTTFSVMEVLSTANWYGHPVYTPDGQDWLYKYVSFSVQNPAVVTPATEVLTTNSNGYTYAAALVDGYVWCITVEGNLARAVLDNDSKTISAFETVVPGFESTYSSSMSYNPVDGRLYYIMYNDHKLKSFSPSDVSDVVEVGEYSIDALTLAINSAGEAYCIEISTGDLYQINLSDASTTLVGNTGLSVGYAQDMAFDLTTGELFWTRESSSGRGLYLVSTSTATAMFIGTIGGGQGAEVTGLFMGESTTLSCPFPTNLTVSGAIETNAVMSWTENGSATSWDYQIDTDLNFPNGELNQYSVTDNPYTLSSLTTGTTYYVRVRANCGGGEHSAWSSPVSFTVYPCEVPDNVTVASSPDGTAIVNWNGHSDTYSVSYRLVGSSEWTTIPSIPDQTYTLTGLPAGDYELSVTADCGDPSSFMTTTFSVMEVLSSANWYGYGAYTDESWVGKYISFSMQNPGTVVEASATLPSMYAAAYADGYVWFIDANNDLCRSALDNSSKTISDYETIVPEFVTEDFALAMSYNPADGKFYYIRGTGNSPRTLMSFDPANPTAVTEIGTFTNATQGLAINNAGEAYSVENTTGDLYRVNLTDASVTLVGNTGHPSYYVQDMAFDLQTGELFWAHYYNSSDNALYMVNPATAATMLIGHIGNGTDVELTGLFMVADETPTCPAPTDLAVETTHPGDATFSWTSGNDYNLRLREVGGEWMYFGQVSSPYPVTTLDANTDYEAQAQLDCGSDGLSDWGNLVSFTTLPCPAPTNLIVSDITLTSAELNWSQSGGGYEWNVEYSTSSDFSSSTTEWVLSSSYSMVNLAPGTTYYVRVQSICPISIPGGVSDVVTFTTEECPAPTNVTVSNITSTTAEINWTQSGAGFEWDIEYSTSSDFSTYHTVWAIDYPWTLDNLVPETTYYVRVKSACYDHIEGGTSAAVTFTTSSVSCPAPTNLTVTNVTKNSATVDWTETGTATTWFVVLNNDLDNAIELIGHPYTLLGLTPETEYTVAVYASCDLDVTSPLSTPVTFTTEGCTAPNDLTLVSAGAVSASLSWASGDTYRLRYRTASGEWMDATAEGVTSPFSLSGLQTGTAYEVQAQRDCGADGLSPWGNIVSFTTETCGVPTDLELLSVSANSITITWASGLPYNVRYRRTTGESDLWHQVTNKMPPYTINGLLPGNTYRVQVQDICATGGNSSTFSTALVVTTLSCTTPDDVTVTDITNNSANVTWTSGSTYNLRYRENGGAWTNVTGATSPYALTGLHPNSFYELQAQKDCGADGLSSWSDVVTFTTAPSIVPTVANITGNSSVCPGNTTELTATSDVEVSYLWSTGETSQTITVGPGDYSVIVTSTTGDELASGIFTVSAKESYTTEDNQSVCQNELPYVWNGESYSTPGNYTKTLTAANGCDSVVTLHLTVNSTYAVTDTRAVCPSELPYTWNGFIFHSAGTQPVTLQTVNGCDSVVTMTLTLNQTYNTPVTATICQGDSYSFFGQTLTAGGTYTHTLQTVNGCDSVITLTLTVNPTYAVTDQRTVCPGELPLTWNGKTFTEAGTKTATLQTVNGCDSTVTMTLHVFPTYNVPVTATVCQGESYSFFGQTLTSGGTYTHTLQTVNGCDSIVTLTLTVNPTYAVTDTRTVCPSELPLTWNGKTFTEAGTQTATLQTANGCDSTVTMTLHVNPAYNVPVTAAICQGDSYSFFGQTLTTGGIYTHTLQTVNGCDSVITLTLTVNPTYLITEERTVCSAGLPYLWNGVVFTGPGTKFATLHTATGCDSVVTMILTVDEAFEVTVNRAVCVDELPIVWNGKTFNAAGTQTVTLEASNGCDSIVTMVVTVNTPVHQAYTVVECGSYTWTNGDGATYTASGTHTYSHTDANGCTQVDTLHLTIHNPVHTAVTVSECGSYTWNGQTYTTSGNYTYSHTDANGCTQVDTLHLTIYNPVNTAITAQACGSFVWNGETYTTSGTHTFSHTDAHGCTQVDTLHLTIFNPVHQAVTVSECGSYTWTAGNGQTYTASGDYTYSHLDAHGCTQVDTLHLTIFNPVHQTVTVSECGSYTWNGQTYTASGNYTHSHLDANGCTQVDTLHLTIFNPVHTAVTVSECGSYTWNGQTYTTSGNYTYSHLDANGCTQVDTLHLTILNPVHQAITVSECGSYTWAAGNGQTYTTSGNYTYSHLDANGCTQVDTLHLTIFNPMHTAVTVSACGSYTWADGNGQTYITSGDYTYSHLDAHGCTQVDTLHLTILHGSSAVIANTICASELPYEWNGVTFTEAGMQTATIDAANGCDSVVTMVLMVNTPVHHAYTAEACGSYTWNGTVYSVSGNYTYSHQDVNGCTQVDTLHLTIFQPANIAITVAECGSYTWTSGNGVTYTASGNYTYSHTDANGCTQVDTLHLTIHNPVHQAVTVSECGSYIWNGTVYETSGTYTYSHLDNNGCTQVDTLHLTIHNPVHQAITVTECGDYTWNGQTYTESGDYTYSHLDNNGCTQVDTLHLTINHPAGTAVTVTECASYTWTDGNGQTYTESGIYTYSHLDVVGCTQVDTLYLTINEPEATTLTATVCPAALPYTWNGVVFTAAGTQSVTLTAANGCDSVVTMTLTVGDAYTTNETVAVCASELPYTWNGVVFTAAGTQSVTLTAANGCDSVVTMTLTVIFAAQSDIYETACGSYFWNNANYTESGDYTATFTAANGCDSVVTLHLTINQSVQTELYETACDSYTWTDGNTYTQSDDYAMTLTAANGCDSIVVLHLTIHNSATSEFSIEWMDDTPYTWNGQEYTESGDYTQTLQTVDGCDSVVTLHLTITVDVDVYDAAAVYIAPNPAKEVCRIVGLESAPISVDLFDMRGKLLMRARSTEFDVSTLPSGMYMVKVNTGDRIINLKLIRQ